MGAAEQLLVGQVVEVAPDGRGRHPVPVRRRVHIEPAVRDQLFQQGREPVRPGHPLTTAYRSSASLRSLA